MSDELIKKLTADECEKLGELCAQRAAYMGRFALDNPGADPSALVSAAAHLRAAREFAARANILNLVGDDE